MHEVPSYFDVGVMAVEENFEQLIVGWMSAKQPATRFFPEGFVAQGSPCPGGALLFAPDDSHESKPA